MMNKEFILDIFQSQFIKYDKLNKVYIATDYVGEHWSDKIVEEFDTKKEALEYLYNSLKNKLENEIIQEEN